jgi:beta-1,4-N-acetylglucosaminyltransferase
MMMILLLIVAVLVLIASILILRAFLVLTEIRTNAAASATKKNINKSHHQRQVPISTIVVLGSGGHTTEMLQLLQPLNPQQYTPLTFIVAKTDTTSLSRVAARKEGRTADHVHHIPRSREVGQSYITSIATTLWSLIYTLGLVIKLRPGLLLCNGPGTCLPIAVWTFVGRLLGLWEGKIVFCESFCRVTRYVYCIYMCVCVCVCVFGTHC